MSTTAFSSLEIPKLICKVKKMCWIQGLMLAYLVQEAASQKEKNLYA